MTEADERVTGEKQRAEEALLHALLEHGLLLTTGVPGIFGRSASYEAVVEGFNRYVTQNTRGDAPTHVHFPPLQPRTNLERVGYLESFPHLAGLIFTFDGNEADHLELLSRIKDGQTYAGSVKMTEVALTSAACQPLYQTQRGRLPEQGKLFDLTSYCFRHEPSNDPARMQSFRMREHVRLGTPTDVQHWREDWYARGKQLLASLGLAVEQVVANDPFFGRGGRMLAANQVQSQLKFELVTPITSEVMPTAVMSFNYHEEHFTALYGVETHAGVTAHSACLGFGLERIAIALFKRHGYELGQWPAAVRSLLHLDGRDPS